MKRLCIAAAVSVLALAGCSSQAAPSSSPTPSVSSPAISSPAVLSFAASCDSLNAATSNVTFVQAGTPQAQAIATKLTAIEPTVDPTLRSHVSALIYAATNSKDLGKSFDAALGRIADVCHWQ